MTKLGFVVLIGSLIWGNMFASYAHDPNQLIAFGSWPDESVISDISIIQLNGENRRNLTHHPADDIQPDWSPDGTQIAFSSNRDGDYDIWIMDADGSNLIKVIDTDVNESDPNWSPDGRHILCRQTAGDIWDREIYHRSDICLISLDEVSIIPLTNEAFINFDGSWSPDGTRIIFVSMYDVDERDTEFYTMRINESRSRAQLTNDGEFKNSPYWISESEILFTIWPEIYVMDLETMGVERVIDRASAPLFFSSDVLVEDGVPQMVFETLDGIGYYNLETEVYFNVDNTGVRDNTMSLRPSNNNSLTD